MSRALVIAAAALASSVLPTPAGPFDEHRLAEPVGEVHDAGDARVGEIVDAAQALQDVGNGVEALGHEEVRAPDSGWGRAQPRIWPSPQTTYL